MNIRYLTLFIFLWPLSVCATTSFNELFDTNLDIFINQADRISTYHAEDIKSEVASTHSELNLLNQALEQELEKQPKHPILWFLKGLNYSNLAAFHANSDKSLSLNFSEQKQQAYNKAMMLDENHSPHLSAAIYATMKHGLPLNDKIKAQQKELGLGGNGDNESYYWYLHWSNINSLQQAGRQQEAELALSNMQREMKARGLDQSVYQQIASQAQKSIEKTKTSPQPATIHADSVETTTEDDETTKPTILATQILWLLIALSVVLFIAAIVYERRAHKKNRTKEKLER